MSSALVSAVVAGQESARAHAAAPPARPGWTYETDFNDLTITGWADDRVTGRYEYAAGRIEGRASGRTVTGYWLQEASPTDCGAVRSGTQHWGRFTFTFSADGSAFSGLWGDCDEAPTKVWNGRLSRRSN